MDSIMRFPEAVPHEPAIDDWLSRRPEPLRSIARDWFAQIRALGTDVTELMHDGCPTACVGDAAFAYVCVFTAHANVGFFHGAFLEDPSGLLQGTGKRMRHVKLRPESTVDSNALANLIRAAYLDIQVRLAK
jgi:hypothetical protein